MYAQISVSGPDAISFLQGQLTQDLQKVSESHSPLAAWCTPQGRVIAVLRLLKLADGIGLILPTDLVDDVINGLSVYRMRAKVIMQAAASDWRALAIANTTDIELIKARHLLPAADANACCYDDGIHVVSPNTQQDFFEIYGSDSALQDAGLSFINPLSGSDWQAARINCGITDIVPATSGKYTPHMLNLDQLGALSFSKGCYPGQEIVARTQHLGSVKRRVAHFRSAAPVALGDAVLLDGTAVGEVVAAANRDVLAVLPVALQSLELHAATVPLQPA
ncbi:MAG: hypothetical protein WBN32_06670 [Woeseia sp.]